MIERNFRNVLRGLVLAAAVTLAIPSGARAQARAGGNSLEAAIEAISQHMVTAFPLKAPRNNIAVIQFVPVNGAARQLGESLVQKVRIRMFEADKEHRLNFVAQGKVTDILVSQGADSLREIYDAKRRVELGKLLTADHFVHGPYELLGDGRVEIVGYLVETESGLIRAQKVVKAEGIPENLLLPVGAVAVTARSYRFSAAAPKSNPEAAKKLRMAELFAERGRQDRVDALHGEILTEYPDSLEAVNVQVRRMAEDVTRLTAEGRYDEPLMGSIQAVPASYTSTTAYRELLGKSAAWLAALGDRDLENGRFDESTAYYDRARKLGLPDAQYQEFQKRLNSARLKNRANAIRALLAKRDRDQAEQMLVEWEADEPNNPLVKQLKKEIDRPEGMVTIPAGRVLGRTVDAFNLDPYETTNKEFLDFTKANPQYQRGKLADGLADPDYLKRWPEPAGISEELEQRPVTFVSQLVAEAYCKWRKKRLPTSDEWGLAAGEGRRKYPWGDQEPTKDLANFDSPAFGSPLPGESHPQGRTPEGVYHMAGNVWELTSTRSGKNAVARGGCYYDKAEILRSDYRGTLTTDLPSYTSRYTGFRCAQ